MPTGTGTCPERASRRPSPSGHAHGRVSPKEPGSARLQLHPEVPSQQRRTWEPVDWQRGRMHELLVRSYQPERREVPPDTVKVVDAGERAVGPVRRLCQGGEQVAVLIGPAGSGKSRSISAARAAWESAGVAVRGVAPSAVAAGVLSEQAGLRSETLAKFLLDASLGRACLRQGEGPWYATRPRW